MSRLFVGNVRKQMNLGYPTKQDVAQSYSPTQPGSIAGAIGGVGKQVIVPPSAPRTGGTGIIKKAGPQPITSLPSTSQNIPHTSYLSANEIDKSSYAFIAKTYFANLKADNPLARNWNNNGRLNS